MRTTTGNYDTSNAVSQKKPVVKVAIGGFTNSYVSETLVSIAASEKKFLRSFNAKFPKIDILKQPFPKSGSFSFSILDKDLDITSALNSNPPINKDVTVSYGYQDLAIADFVVLETQKLTEPIRLNSDLQTYDFVSRDVRRLLRGNIGRKKPTTNLDVALGATDIVVQVDSLSGFINPANLPNQFDVSLDTGLNARGYLQIKNEIIAYRTIDSGNVEFDINVSADRHCMSAKAIVGFPDYAVGTEVEQVFAFQSMYPTEAILYLLLTTDDGTGHAFYDLASHDDGFKGMGFETDIAAADIDIEGIERLGWKFFNNGFESCMTVLITEETDGLEFIIENFLKPGGLYMYIETGIIKIKTLDRLDLITNFVADDALTKDDFVNNRIESFLIDPKTIINRINFSWQIDPITNDKTRSWELKHDNSVTQYGSIEEPFVINSPLVAFKVGIRQPQTIWRTSLNIQDQVRDVIVRRWFYTFQNPLGVLDFKVMPDKWLLQPTDWITITHDKIPDSDAGTRGWTNKKFFITEQSMDPLSNPPIFSYKALTWEALTDVSDPYSFTTIAQGSIDDTDIAFNSNNTITLNTEDGFWDHAGLAQSALEILIIKIGITPPNTGSTHHWVKLSIHLIGDDVGDKDFIHHSQHYRAIRYLSSDSAEFDIELIILPIYDPTKASTVERVKVDWWDASHGSTERPSAITFKEIKYGAFGEAMSSVKELLN